MAITVPTRADVEARYKRDLSARAPGTDVSDNSPADVDTKQVGGALSPVYACAVQIDKGAALKGKSHEQLRDELQQRGSDFLPAAGASGFVLAKTATGGATISAGDGGTINGKGYVCAATALYQDGDPVPVQAVDTGPATNQPGGAILTWSPGIVGLGPTAAVLARPDGRGLIGGADAETDAEAVQRLQYENAHPAASGNSADYIDRGENTPALAVEQVFAYPGIQGSGTSSFVATMRRTDPSVSRIPNPIEQAKIGAWMPGAFPGDDNAMMAALVSNPVTLAISIALASGSAWADAAPWPAYANPMVQVKASPAPTATTFRLTNVGATVPAAGMTVAFYDAVSSTFRNKRILTATFVAGTDYDIVCDTTGGASDITYAPAAGQPCGPWSDSLDVIVAPLLAALAKLGPGEQVASFWDPGLRQRRSPAPPEWPYTITNRLIDGLDAVTAVADQNLLIVVDGGGYNAIPYVTPVGSAGVSSYLNELQFLAVFAE